MTKEPAPIEQQMQVAVSAVHAARLAMVNAETNLQKATAFAAEKVFSGNTAKLKKALSHYKGPNQETVKKLIQALDDQALKSTNTRNFQPAISLMQQLSFELDFSKHNSRKYLEKRTAGSLQKLIAPIKDSLVSILQGKSGGKTIGLAQERVAEAKIILDNAEQNLQKVNKVYASSLERHAHKPLPRTPPNRPDKALPDIPPTKAVVKK